MARFYITSDQLLEMMWLMRRLDSLSGIEKLRVIEKQVVGEPKAVDLKADAAPTKPYMSGERK